VSASFYCDTSALVNLYHQEVGADARQLDVGTLEGLQVLHPEIPAEKQT
jgi:hypothetical protein